MKSADFYPFLAVFNHFELFLPIFSCFYPFACPENGDSKQNYPSQAVFDPVQADFTHFELLLPIMPHWHGHKIPEIPIKVHFYGF